ncbi:protein NLP6-like isoform X6 [Camellia sinensis]|uniref:protein NLP6-like isoform X6 n=1 Tax=Camellia sinensis TaxID=4442 RepID=UPI0010356601|nr:protein NLP6-like isoform X6 [Camellia sinensis]
MMLLLHGAGEGGGIHEGGGRGDEGMDRDGYQDLETEIKSWQPEDRNSGVFCSYGARSEMFKSISGQTVQDKNEAALRDEILDVLKQVLEVYPLPLAQIWRTCRVCRSLFNNGVFGLSRMSGLSYLMEENGEIFLRACGHHHLRMGMAVVGTALKSLNLVFCADVTQFSITEYPMTHYAREFGLSGCGCFSIRGPVSFYLGTGKTWHLIEVLPSF